MAAPDQDLRVAITMISYGFNMTTALVGKLAERVDDETLREECLESVEILLKLSAALEQMFPTDQLPDDGSIFH